VVIFHAGLPLALASSKHFVFEVIPETNFGYARVKQDTAPVVAVAPPVAGVPGLIETKRTGVHLDVGARAGAEVHFGFMGLPNLSLLGTIGLRFSYDKLGYDVHPVGGSATHMSTTVWGLRTTLNESPWSIFVGNVGALYYF
jgi:hypothetical protein